MIELGTIDSLKLVVAEFEHSHIIHCAQNPNGNHVLQKCKEFTSKIITSSPDKNEVHGLYAVLDYIVAALQSKAREMSRNPYGCRVIQRIMEYCTENQKSQVLIEIRDHFKELIKDQYGNYVIQHLIRYGGATDRASLTKIILTNLVDFLQHKFASNVVEKFLQYTNRFDRDEVIWTLIKMLFDTPLGVKLGNSILDTMLKNSYANYVIQKVVDVSDTRQREVIVGYFTENAGHIRKYANGKRIIAHLEKVTGLKF